MPNHATVDPDLQAALDYRATLTRNTLVLTTESEPRFNALLDSYIRKFQPRDVVEMDLVIDMVACRWRQRRAQGLETALLDIELFEQRDTIRKEWTSIDNTSRAALAWKALTDNTGALSALNRYEARLRRQYHRTLQMLLDLRAGKQADKQTDPAPEAPVPAEAEKENLPNEPTAAAAPPPTAPPPPQTVRNPLPASRVKGLRVVPPPAKPRSAKEQKTRPSGS